ncbi:BlaI/MecI/CopY family transcriptional regulator [Streptomyces fungicidicus]|uniref:BlaI/MecI/CopY family transcriptional regulator n=1 Tax=Streptomyces fungicidicus TaxID=68203 RepID=UPI0036338B75
MATEMEKPSTQSLQSQYAEQFTNHLSSNRKEQARLRVRLEQLQADEAWLVRALETLSAPAESGLGTQAAEDGPAQPQDSASRHIAPSEATAPSQVTDTEASATVPNQRQDKQAKAPAKKTATKRAHVKETAAKKTSPPQREVKKAAVKKAPAAKKKAAKAGEPTLGELLLFVLGKHAGQPRTASEVVGELEREYPRRARDTGTVRNTLERLVAKGRVERMRQKNTVLYTAVTESAPAADSAAVKASPAAETAGGEEAENIEKLPAQA